MPAATATEVEPPPGPLLGQLLDAGWFARRMDALGPWVGGPVAVAVSGGADSLALAWMVRNWQRDGASDRPGGVRALVVDHGLRAASADEARVTLQRLDALGIDAELLTLDGLRAGPGIAARARAARYLALTEGCARAGIVDLLVAHHAGDQAETVAIRRAARSGAAGLAGMAMIAEQSALRIVRPLLDCPPAALRATLRAAAVGWVEDPSNHDLRVTRARVRHALRDDPARAAALLDEAAAAAQLRGALTDDGARALAEHVRFGADGSAFIACAPSALPVDAFAALIQAVGGAGWPPSATATSAFAVRAGRGATLGGARLLPARAGWWLVREAAGCAPRCPATAGVVWDDRFRFAPPEGWAPPDPRVPLSIGALGTATLGLRRGRGLPPLARRAALPAVFAGDVAVCVPHLGWWADGYAAIRLTAAWAQPAVRQPRFHEPGR